MCFRSFRFPRCTKGQLGRRFDPPPPEGSLLTPMRPYVPHRPPPRFFYLASSASSSFIFRFLRDGDVGVCSPSRRVFLIAVPLVMKRAHSTSPKAHKKGEGGGPQFRAFPSWVSSFSCLRSSYVGVCTGLFVWLVLISKVVVGTPTEGDMARFRLRFRGCLHVPHQNRPTKKSKNLHL